MKCIDVKEKGAHLPFDEYLDLRKDKCQHSAESECVNCLPPRNVRL